MLLLLVSLSIPNLISAAGPGGVSADLEVWLKADAGINETDGEGVDSWNDQSSQTNHATQTDTTQTHPTCLLYTSPSPRDRTRSRMPSSA